MSSSSQKKGGDSAILLVFKANEKRRAPVITNPTAINACFVRLAEVNILGVEDLGEGPLRVHVECVRTIQGCPQCGVIAYVKDRPEVELVDLPVYASLDAPDLA